MSFKKKRAPKLGSSQADLDEQFDAFLKESLSSEDTSLDTARVSKYLQPKKKAEPSAWWMKDDEEDIGTGLSTTGRSFMKAKKPEKSIAEEDTPSTVPRKPSVANGHDVGLSHDSLEDESFGGRNKPRQSLGSGIPALSLGSSYSETTTGDAGGAHGLDTLAELADKKKFFEEMEKNSGDSTIDYSRLNRDLDKSVTLGGTLTSGEGALDNRQGSEDYTDDAHLDEEDPPEEITARRVSIAQPERTEDHSGSSKQTSMLSKVALLDSLDSTLGTKRASSDGTKPDDMKTIPEATESRPDSCDAPHVRIKEPNDKDSSKGLNTGFGFTNTSREIEELHQALKNVGMSTLTGDYTLHNSSAVMASGPTENTAADGTQGGTNATGFGLQPLAPTSSEDEQETEVQKDPINSDDDTDAEVRGFALSPVGQDTGTEDDQDNNSPVEKYAAQLAAASSRTSSITPQEDRPKSPPKPAKRRNQQVKPREESSSKYKHVRGSGYGQSLPPKPQTASKAADQWSPAHLAKQKIQGSQIPVFHAGKDGSIPDSQLLASVQSFASYIQDHFTDSIVDQITSSIQRQAPEVQWSQEGPAVSSSLKVAAVERERALMSEVKEWQEQWKEERNMHTKLKADYESLENEVIRKLEQQRMEFEEQMFKLKQDNYVLNAKVSETDNTALRERIAEASSAGLSSEQLELMEREVREQEQLLAGYHTENQRLYTEMKKLQTIAKTTEEKMFRENDRLRVEVNNLREQLDRREMELRTKGLITSTSSQQQIAAGNVSSAVLGAGRIAQLEGELKQAKRECEDHKQDISVLTKEKQELEKHIAQMVAKIDEVEKMVKQSQSSQSQESKDIEARHAEEIGKLQRKLKWYAQNQELLDNDVELIKKKDNQIKELKNKLDNTNKESGNRQSELKAKSKERAADAKRIQDLERQVKEMEGILRKRNPNSLPVLMWAASNAPDAPHGNKAPSVEFLEKRIKKLEAELEEKDDESKISLRGMEQKFNAVKFQYEERIEDLENRLSRYERPDDRKLKEGDHPHSHVGALQKELEAVRERHKKQVAELEAEMEKVVKENSSLKAREAANTKALEAEVHSRVKSLEEKLANLERERQLLQRTVERLQKEKQQTALELARHTNISKHAERMKKASGPSADKAKPEKRSRSRSRPSSAKSGKSENSEPESVTLQPYSSMTSSDTDKQYQPQSFSGLHIEEVLQENEQLKIKLDRMQLEQDQQRIQLQGLLAQAEAQNRHVQEEAEEKMHALRSSHQQEVQRLLTDHALKHSASTLMELQSRLDTQEVMVSHLKQQLADSRVDGEEVSRLRIRETTLESQLQQLLDDLQDAKKNHTPEMRHFESLQGKLKRLESRHAQREAELQQIIDKAQVVARVELHEETEKWQQVVHEKNREIEHFRAELDSILGVLRVLQQQGVVVPTGKNGTIFR